VSQTPVPTPAHLARLAEARRGDDAEAVEAAEHPAVTAALERLAELTTRPVADQVAGYEEVHRALQGALASIDAD